MRDPLKNIYGKVLGVCLFSNGCESKVISLLSSLRICLTSASIAKSQFGLYDNELKMIQKLIKEDFNITVYNFDNFDK